MRSWIARRILRATSKMLRATSKRYGYDTTYMTNCVTRAATPLSLTRRSRQRTG
jgi:hypothetical protein